MATTHGARGREGSGYQQPSALLVLSEDVADVLHEARLGHPADVEVLLHVERLHAQVEQQVVDAVLLRGKGT